MSSPKETESLARASWTYKVRPVFVIGCPRSGTTWVQALLASAPSIHTGPEMQFFRTFNPVREEYLRPKDHRLALNEYMSRQQFHEAMAQLFWTAASSLPEPEMQPLWFVDSSPDNTLAIDFILESLPEARFVHVIRDARAVVHSLLSAGRSWGAIWAPTNASQAAKEWVSHVTAGRSLQQRMPEQYLELRYEEMRQDTAGHLKRVFDWLNVALDDAAIRSIVDQNSLEAVKKGEAFRSIPMPGKGDVKPLSNTKYPEGFFGRGAVRAADVPLSKLQRIRVDFTAGPLLRDLNYPDVGPAPSLLQKLMISNRLRVLLRLPQI